MTYKKFDCNQISLYLHQVSLSPIQMSAVFYYIDKNFPSQRQVVSFCCSSPVYLSNSYSSCKSQTKQHFSLGNLFEPNECVFLKNISCHISFSLVIQCIIYNCLKSSLPDHKQSSSLWCSLQLAYYLVYCRNPVIFIY